MIKVMIETMIDLWNGDWFAKVLFFLLLSLFLFLFFLILYGIYFAVDSWFVGEQDGIGVVSDKYFSESHTTTTWIMSGKVMIPITNYYPDTWGIWFSVDGKQDSIEVDESLYDKVNVGDRFSIRLKEGRISNNIYITDIIY